MGYLSEWLKEKLELEPVIESSFNAVILLSAILFKQIVTFLKHKLPTSIYAQLFGFAYGG